MGFISWRPQSNHHVTKSPSQAPREPRARTSYFAGTCGRAPDFPGGKSVKAFSVILTRASYCSSDHYDLLRTSCWPLPWWTLGPSSVRRDVGQCDDLYYPHPLCCLPLHAFTAPRSALNFHGVINVCNIAQGLEMWPQDHKWKPLWFVWSDSKLSKDQPVVLTLKEG